MPLARCPSLFGGCNYFASEPRIEQYSNAFVKEWSLYDEQRRIIMPSTFMREFGEFQLIGGGATTRVNPAIAPRLEDGPYFWLGAFHPHFGHFLISTLTRLWAYPLSGATGVKIAYTGDTSPEQIFSFPFAADIFSALGIRIENLIRVPQFTVFSDIIVAEPCFVENSSVHAAFSTMLKGVGDALAPRQFDTPDDRPVYFSKELLTSGVSRISNEMEFTRVLHKAGVEIVYPEKLSLAEQIRLWKSRRFLSAYAGSALHCAAFVRPRSVISLCHDRYAQSNQALIGLAGQHATLSVHPEGDMESLPSGSGFSAVQKFRYPQKTAEAFLRALDKFMTNPDQLASRPRSPTSSVCRYLYPNEPFGENVALNKPARQSSSDPLWEINKNETGTDAGLAVSGKLSSTYQFHTKNEELPWWDVDLGVLTLVNEIRVFNRHDTAIDRASNISIYFSDDGVEWSEVGRRDDPGTFAGLDSEPYRWIAPRALITRFVRLTLVKQDYLHLNQVEVFGIPSEFAYF